MELTEKDKDLIAGALLHKAVDTMQILTKMGISDLILDPALDFPDEVCNMLSLSYKIEVAKEVRLLF